MKKNVFNLILLVLLCSFVLSCTINTKTLFEKDFVFVKGATIEGAIQAEGYPESPGFVAGRTVTIADFYMCDHEVTQKEFAQYYEGYEDRINQNEKAIGDNYPAYDVNWFDALIYCNKRSINEGLTPCFSIGGERNPDKWGTEPTSSKDPRWDDWYHAQCDFSANGYRLPTIVEWEYAARGGNGLTGYQYKYAGSDNLNEVAWSFFGDIILESSQEVMQKKPNTLGIYDMSGNVEEWCWERHGNDTQRRYAGGDWRIESISSFYLSDLRQSWNLTTCGSQWGFRPVRNAE